MKSSIGNLAIHPTGIEPASLRRRVRIEFGYVWLDVEQGSVVEDVYVDNVEDASFAPHQPDSGHADRIRPARRTGREQTPRSRVSRYGTTRGWKAGCAIHPVDQPDPIEALDVIQRAGEGVGHDDLPLRILGIDGLNGRARGLDEWRLNAANHLRLIGTFFPATTPSGYY